MIKSSRSLLIAALAGAAILGSALSTPASAHRGGGGGGGGRPSFGGFHPAFHPAFHGGGRGGAGFHAAPRRSFAAHGSGRGFGSRHGGHVWAGRHFHHYGVYGGPVIPVLADTDAAIATAPAIAPAVAPLPAADCAASTASLISVTFLATATSADITAFLQSYHVTLADGPDADGIYRIRLSDQPLPPARIDEVVASMRSRTMIVGSVRS